MWCEKLKSGKVKYFERYKDPLTLEWKRVSIVMEKDTSSMRKKAFEELQRKIDAKIMSSEGSNLTLKQILDKYIAYQEKTVKLSTLERNRRTLSKMIDLLGENVLIEQLTAQYIKNKLLDTKQAPGTLNEYLKRLKSMFKWAFENDLTNNANLVQKLTYFKDTPHREKIKDKYLEPEELKLLLSYIENSKCWNWYYLTKFLTLSGLRIGEATALLSSDIDETVIHVTKTYDPINRIITSPKTATSTRDVFIQPELHTLIKQIRIYEKQYRFENGIRSDLFICNKQGDYISYYAYEKFICEASEKVLGRRITIHALRHTHASLLLANGIGIDTISRRLGHENSRITKEIYLHITKKIIENDNNELKKAKLL